MFWTEHPPHDATGIVRRYLGAAVRDSRPQVCDTTGHHYWRFCHAKDFDLLSVKKQIRADLDRIEWLFVTTRDEYDHKGEHLLSFGIAPVLPRKLDVGYHATRSSVIHRAVDLKEGLLPSNEERQMSDYPDTEGAIHVCAKLTGRAEDKDSAEWWMGELPKKSRFMDPHWGILRIDMARLPESARVYQDMHSQTGVVVDRFDQIPAELLTVIRL